MAFLMLIALYTSRVILQKLGIDDYGIYNVVGSVVGMFVSLRSMFAGATQRFLNYEMGSDHPERVSTVFNTSTFINWGLGIIFVLAVEVVGLWFLNEKINVPPDRLFATYCVFHLSVLTTFISIISIPYDACIIAHERMDYYAFVSVFEGLAKLGICYLLTLWNFDRLILYSILMLSVSIILRVVNVSFCKYNFHECYFKFEFNKSYFLRMTSFAGWAFFGNTAFALSMSGQNMILNVFGGPAVNAARGICSQVSGALSQFVGNITIVLRPFMGKVWAAGETDKVFQISFLSSKLYFFIQILFVTIVSFHASRILQLWLGVIPEYTVCFLNIILWQSLIKAFHAPIDNVFAGNGDIKLYQLAEGIILFLPVPASYLLLSWGYPYYTSLITCLIAEAIHILVITYLCKKVCGFPLKAYYKSVILPCMGCIVFYTIGYGLNSCVAHTFVESVLCTLLTFLSIISCMYLTGLSEAEKQIVIKLLRSII
jgi:O-antigen/teichoic acid export membrane protein